MNPKTQSEHDQAPGMNPEPAPSDFSLDRAERDISDWDRSVFQNLISIRLTPEQEHMVITPRVVLPRQKEVLAIHWHPEWIPFDLINQRIAATFPNLETQLIIPTQHNDLLTLGEYAGVEVDCYASGFQRKVQLLLHFRAERVQDATILQSMLEHTFKYRSGQLFDFMETIVKPEFQDRMHEAAEQTGANEQLVRMLQFYTARLQRMILDFESEIPPAMIKNKLLAEFVDAQRERHPDIMVNRALLLLKAVKKIVKRHFPLNYFFRVNEVIEEVRSLGGCVVVPHPEQFWPILLADYDVDGYEVWNPQSQEYTEFLITATNNQNKMRRSGRRKLLVCMGDDTHLSIKIRPGGSAERDKYEREVGLQPAWDDVGIRKTLSLAGASRLNVIKEYRDRLA